MTAHGPWYISARAVKEYAALARLGDANDPAIWDRAESELIAMARETAASGREPRPMRSGALRYRGPRPLRLTLIVTPGPRPEGDLPQLVRVLPESQRG